MEITATNKDLIPGCVARWDVIEGDKTYDFILMETGEDVEKWPHGTGCLYVRDGKFRAAMCVNLSVALDAAQELFARKIQIFEKLKANI